MDEDFNIDDGENVVSCHQNWDVSETVDIAPKIKKIRLRRAVEAWPLSDNFEKLMTFHKNPTVELFNEIVALDVELFRDNNIEDEMYVRFENEGYKRHKNRLKDAKKQIADGTVDQTSNFCDPHILIWARAAVLAHPYLLLDCARPLYVDRANRFYSKSYNMDMCRLINIVSNDADYDDTFELSRTLSLFALLQFGASGNTKYIRKIIAILEPAAAREEFVIYDMAKILRACGY